MVGELVVLEGSNELPPGTALPLPREGTLGCLRTCDVTLPAPGVAPCHLDFSFQDGKGLLIYPRVRCAAQVDGSSLLPAAAPGTIPCTMAPASSSETRCFASACSWGWKPSNTPP